MDPSKAIRIYIFLLGAVVLVAVAKFFTPPLDYPVESLVTIDQGANLYEVGEKLKEERVIRSPFLFRAAAILLGGERRMKAGEYYMEKPQSPFLIAWRILHGRYDVDTMKITVPEGYTVEKISKLFDERFRHFDTTYFLRSAPEGYLFPDTYFVPITANASSTIKVMRDNFIRKIFPLMPDIEKSGKTLEEVVIMASLIEGETNTQIDREIVSGILWKRLKIGMPLQVDVEMKTYEFVGLPKSPINNPGLNSIKAAISPTTTPYLYYLTGDDGKMYYSRTFEEHVEKKNRHIRN